MYARSFQSLLKSSTRTEEGSLLLLAEVSASGCLQPTTSRRTKGWSGTRIPTSLVAGLSSGLSASVRSSTTVTGPGSSSDNSCSEMVTLAKVPISDTSATQMATGLLASRPLISYLHHGRGEQGSGGLTGQVRNGSNTA